MTAQARMISMMLEQRAASLVARKLPVPEPGVGEILLKVHAYGVCRTDLHIHDGELVGGKLPVTPGHEIVGTIVAVGKNVTGFKTGERLGVPCLGWTCGECVYCRNGREPRAKFRAACEQGETVTLACEASRNGGAVAGTDAEDGTDWFAHLTS